jgi:hypothetical protein
MKDGSTGDSIELPDWLNGILRFVNDSFLQINVSTR